MPWLPFPVFWDLVSAGALHHGLTYGTVCKLSILMLSMSRTFLSTVLISSLCHIYTLPPRLFFLYSTFSDFSLFPLVPLLSSLSSTQIDSISVLNETWGPAVRLSGSFLCVCKTDGARRPKATETERKNQRERQKEKKWQREKLDLKVSG